MYLDEYVLWKEGADFDPETRKAVAALTEAEIAECFGSELEFGTGGLRGIMGVGPNRMNRYTVRKATAGLAAYLNKSGVPSPLVVVAHDSRTIRAIIPENLRPKRLARYARQGFACTCSAGSLQRPCCRSPCANCTPTRE